MIRKQTNDRITNRRRPKLWQNCKNFPTLKQIHASIVVNGLMSNLSVVGELIYSASLSVPGALKYAHKLFDGIPEPDVSIFNHVLRGSAQSLRPENTVALYTEMERRGVSPDRYTFTFLLKACSKLEWRSNGFAVHGKVLRHGFVSNEYVKNALILFHANCGDLGIASELFDDSAKAHKVAWSSMTSGYAKRGKIDEAMRLFDEMPEKDQVAWNVMITGCLKCKEIYRARELFDRFTEKDVVTWNAMISGYVNCGHPKEALSIFKEMRDAGEHPDVVTILSLLSACGDLGDLETGKSLHHYILETASFSRSSIYVGTPIWNALIDMYAKCGSIDRATEVFRGMKDRDLSTWNTLIVGLALHHAEGSIEIFEEMQRLKVWPNEVTFIGVILACSHSGRVDEGSQYFSLMKDMYNIEPNLKHYGCMVDMLGRAGLLEEAFMFVESMKIEPNAIVWRTLLGACKIYGNVELGKYANEKLLSMRKDESGDYMLLSNIYASTGQWDAVQNVRKMFDDTRVKKPTGISLIEEDNDKLMMRYLLSSEPESKSRGRTS
ncbi:PREDICTED: pentatricopeptide repeat-containing protein At5g15300-like [Camelina sativa]|uniref:Pentatricopeptide repeat-containing protein At5g15300-like n=1 Tax=Camelina sativa TaxID=90675 RepID=A0ABM0TCB9_CAMSA|nr:PREDICTED: pentatricopeptide repeat-containing protein At5g15300-like [Camelina sativa]